MLPWTWIFVLMIAIAAIGIYGRRRRAKRLLPEGLFIVAYDSDGIEVTDPSGASRRFPWTQISRVTIRTTDEGPFSPDVFWDIHARHDDAAISFPGGASGESELLAELQRRLDGFDSEQLIAAMASTSNARFVLWQARKP